jgi:hypothetical protein
MRPHTTAAADPFDLPDWLATAAVTWTAETGTAPAALVHGELSGGDQPQVCDVLAGDVAFPDPVLEDKWRSAAHQAWSLGEVLLVQYDGRLTLVVPGTAVSAEVVLDALRRLARAVAVPTDRFTVSLRLQSL